MTSDQSTIPMAHLLFFFLLISMASSCTAKVILGIDCGGSKPFTDRYGIDWVPDGSYVPTADSKAYHNTIPDADQELTTLRAFTSAKRKRTCYTIPVDVGTKVTTRVRFYYGNYDGRQKPPEFALQFDGNKWDTVSLTMGNVTTYEAIYVTRRNDTNICVARTIDGQDPIVSSIELSALRPEMYAEVNSSFALFRSIGEAFGSQEIIRHPDDKFDREWTPDYTANLTILTNEATTINTNIDEDPPAALFATAATPADNAANITLSTPFLPSIPTRIHLSLYFTEVTPQVNRSFDVYMDGVRISNASDAIVPEYGSVLEYTNSEQLVASEKTVFDLVQTPGSTLPPIISGWELFQVSDPLVEGTNGNDVEGLASLQKAFKVLQDWNGDPCLPVDFNWEWVHCTNEASPRINRLHLDGYGLSGRLPDFSALDALEMIDLNRNNLTGDVPEFLGKLPKLKLLNLDNNDFTSIPTSLSNKKGITISINENPKLCKSGKPCSVSHLGSAEKEPYNIVITITVLFLYVIFTGIVGTLN